MARTTGALEHRRQPRNIHVSLIFEAVRIDFRRGRGKDKIDLTLVQLFAIVLQGTRIARQILGAVELHRVDEDTGHHHIRAGFGGINQLHMTIVQVAHGGNQRNALAFLA